MSPAEVNLLGSWLLPGEVTLLPPWLTSISSDSSLLSDSRLRLVTPWLLVSADDDPPPDPSLANTPPPGFVSWTINNVHLPSNDKEIYRPAFSLWKVLAWHHHHHWLYWRHPHNSWWSWRVWRWWRRWWTLSALPGPVWLEDKCRLHNLHKSSWINISSLFDTLIIHRVDATISTVLRRSSIRIIKVTRPASSRMTGAKEDSGDLLRHILDVDPWLRLRLLVTHDPLSPVTRWPLTPLHCMQISSPHSGDSAQEVTSQDNRVYFGLDSRI